MRLNLISLQNRRNIHLPGGKGKWFNVKKESLNGLSSMPKP